MKLKELIPILADDTIITLFEKNHKVVFEDLAYHWKPHTIETKDRKGWIDDLEIDYIVPEDLDELIVYLY